MTAGRTVNSKSQEWCTPPKYAKAIELFFENRIDLDPCSNQFSIIKATSKYLFPEKDGLVETWNFRHIFVNPPYGAQRDHGTTIKDWIKRCWEANYLHGAEVLALIPVATNTSHWKHFIWGKASAICFLYDTRLKFLVDGKDEGKGAPMSCAMVYWGTRVEQFSRVFLKFGAVTDVTLLQNTKIAGDENKKRQLSIFDDASKFQQHI